MDELHSQSDRGCGIVGGAIVEELLTDLLRTRLIADSGHTKRLFEGNGPLSVFSYKIDLAYSVGMISRTSRTNLHTVRAIRNRFAHHLKPLTFYDEKIAGWCDRLPTIGHGKDFSPRARFEELILGKVVVLSIVAGRTTRISAVMDGLTDEDLDKEVHKVFALLEQ